MQAVSINSDELDELCKRIVDNVYSDILSKIGANLIVYKGQQAKSDTYSAYIDSEVQRYKMLQRYVVFLRRNSSYYSAVRNELLRSGETIDNTLLFRLGLDTQGDKQGSVSSYDTDKIPTIRSS